MNPKMLLVGASGLVGQGVLKVLLADVQPAHVSVLVRNPLPDAPAGIRVLQIPDFSDAALQGLDLSGIDVCLYCAGPLPLFMSAANYREATVGVLERVARAFARANPRGYLIYVSGAAANATSRWMPLRIKGEAEQVPGRAGLACTCLRPGGIAPTQGERSPHSLRRFIYTIASPVLALAGKLVPGTFTTTAAVGRCMLALARAKPPYPAIVENRQINEYGKP